MSKHSDDEYTYLEWITVLRNYVNTLCDLEVMRISHDDEDERPRAFIRNIKMMVERLESQIPDNIKD